MTEAERRDLLDRIAAGEDVCRLQCICEELGIHEDDDEQLTLFDYFEEKWRDHAGNVL